MIRLVEKVLGIDAGISKVYRYGYKNNHAAQEQPHEKKRRERDYDPTDLKAYEPHDYKRQRPNDYTGSTQ
jgi:hypothetical protein